MLNQNLKINGKQLVFVQDKAQFSLAMQQIAKIGSFAIDTEFDRNRKHYGFNVCVIQIATEKHCYIIDPIAVADKTTVKAALQPLWELISSPTHQKVIHACSEDIRLFAKYGCVSRNFFDTKIAAQMLCIEGGDSLKTLTQSLLGKELDKSLQKTDWFRRPLTLEHLLYLSNDVVYLLQIKELLEKQLHEKQRFGWFEEENSRALLVDMDYNYDADIQSLQNKQQYRQFGDFQRFVFNQVWANRDQEAKKANVPPFFIFSNEILFAIAANTDEFIAQHDFKGFHRMLQAADKQQEFINFLRAQQQEAQRLELATEFVYKHDQQFADYKRKKQEAISTFEPIKQHLQRTLGEATEKLLLSNSDVEKIAQQQSLSALPRYAAQLISQAAEELSIDLRKYQN